MLHLRALLYLLTLMSGAAALVLTLLLYLQYRRRVIAEFGLFLISLMLLVAGFAVELYGELLGSRVDTALIADLFLLLQAAGGLLFIYTGPFLIHSLLGIPFSAGLKRTVLLFDLAVTVVALIFLTNPAALLLGMILNAALFLVVAASVVVIAANLGRIGDGGLRRGLLAFLLLTAAFFPLLYLDVLISNFAVFSVLAALDDLSLPLYFLILTVGAILFAARRFNRPPYLVEQSPSEYFIRSYAISPREEEILSRLLAGESTRDIAAALFISPKTVENHIYSLYRKTGVKNRVQLFHLLRSNAE